MTGSGFANSGLRAWSKLRYGDCTTSLIALPRHVLLSMREQEQDEFQYDIQKRAKKLSSYEACPEYLTAWIDATALPRCTSGKWFKSDGSIVDNAIKQLTHRTRCCDRCGVCHVNRYSIVLDKQYCSDCFGKDGQRGDTRYLTNVNGMSGFQNLRRKDAEPWAELRAKADHKAVLHTWEWETPLDRPHPQGTKRKR